MNARNHIACTALSLIAASNAQAFVESGGRADSPETIVFQCVDCAQMEPCLDVCACAEYAHLSSLSWNPLRYEDPDGRSSPLALIPTPDQIKELERERIRRFGTEEELKEFDKKAALLKFQASIERRRICHSGVTIERFLVDCNEHDVPIKIGIMAGPPSAAELENPEVAPEAEQTGLVDDPASLPQGKAAIGTPEYAAKVEQRLREAMEAYRRLEGRETMKKAYGATGTGVSGDPGVNTRSGWTPAKKRYVQATDQVMEQADEMGHKLRENSSLDNGVPGRSQASHAAKQTSVADPNMGGAVSKDMCDGCQDWYQDRATSTQEPLVVEDPSVVRVFHTDGAIDVYSR